MVQRIPTGRITGWEYTVAYDEFGNIENRYYMPVRDYGTGREGEILEAVRRVAASTPEAVESDLRWIGEGWDPYADPDDGDLYAAVRDGLDWADPEDVADAVGYFLTEVAA